MLLPDIIIIRWAERVEILDMIQEELQKKGLLAKLQDYEPVDFWGQNNYNE